MAPDPRLLRIVERLHRRARARGFYADLYEHPRFLSVWRVKNDIAILLDHAHGILPDHPNCTQDSYLRRVRRVRKAIAVPI